MKVAHIHRKQRPENFSIEACFEEVRRHLNGGLKVEVKELSRYSNGLRPRLQLIREAAGIKADIYHVTGDIHFVALGLPKNRTILTIHDCGFMNHSSPVARAILKLFWLKLPVSGSSIITTVSEATKKDVIRFTNCDPQKVRVIPTIIKSVFEPAPKIFNKEYPVILHIGTKANKNLYRHIEALQAIPCKLIIIGPLSENDRQLLHAKEIDFRNEVQVSQERLLEIYREIDLLLFASTFEGFGMPIVETQATGRPVITSNISSMPEVAGSGACLIDPYSVKDIRRGLIQVIEHGDYREQLIEEGFENVKRFSAGEVARQYEALYREILASQ